MSDFDSRARDWDKEMRHVERSQAIAAELLAEGCGAFAATGSEDLIFAADLLLNSFCQKEGSSSAALVLLLLIEGAVV